MTADSSGELVQQWVGDVYRKHPNELTRTAAILEAYSEGRVEPEHLRPYAIISCLESVDILLRDTLSSESASIVHRLQAARELVRLSIGDHEPGITSEVLDSILADVTSHEGVEAAAFLLRLIIETRSVTD